MRNMPNIFGEEVWSVNELVDNFRRHGDKVRGTYKVHYVFDATQTDAYAGATLERPPAFAKLPGGAWPWEQVIVAAANCAGSDYPMIAEHLGIPLERVKLDVECVFDPRGEFDGFDGWRAPADAKDCYLSLHLRATLRADAPREALEKLHQRVVSHNMVLGALRGIPRTDEVIVEAPARAARSA